MSPRAWEQCLVGYRSDCTSFPIYNTSKRNVRESRSVIFFETPSELAERDLDSVSGFKKERCTYDENDDLRSDARDCSSCVSILVPSLSEPQQPMPGHSTSLIIARAKLLIAISTEHPQARSDQADTITPASRQLQ